ncbi:MAG: ABC transporter ATP-binding protein/permease, partial [Candidatus Ureaplasma intestinipullorum]|nr:ABC transporter ATP-binding protein/permease [Candidatus Ureaplasma intestinipullorum]
NVNAQKTIKLLNLEEYQLEHFEPLNTNMYKIYTRTGVIQSAILPTIYFFLDISIVLGTWLSPKTMMAELSSLLLFLGLILSAMVSCTLAIININKGISCSKRILEFLNYKYKIVYPTRNLEKIGNELNVKNLKYNYDNFELNVESFSLKDKEKIGIFGLNNSGKSTFINLLTHQLKNKSNSIFVDEENINNFSKNDLSKLYSYCPQNIQLFSGTIKSNLLLANSKANNELMDEILEIVNLNLFSGNNKDSEIGEFGKKLSGGQKQRLMIARTLIKESNIYIFDDCFSALDRITQSEIISRILKLNKTIIIASQKPNLIKNCDKIYVFENGNIINYGTHEYLMKNCSYYSQSYKEVLLD